MHERRERLQQLMMQQGTRAAWIVKPENMRYLSGYTGEGGLLVCDGDCYILTDFRYIEQAQRESPDCIVEQTSNIYKPAEAIHKVLRMRGITKLAFEPEVMTVSEYNAATEILSGIEMTALGGLPEQLRAIKDKQEIDCIIKASNIACQAFDQLLTWVKPGMTEREIQLKLDYAMMELGSETVAFDTIACAGPNGSLPHATPSDRPVQLGELLTLDFGAQVNGYKCDMTRTIAIGEVSDELRAIYDTVLMAQESAFEAIKPGAICRDIDKIARDIIEPRYPGAFGHSLGHAVGLFIHEEPSFRGTCDATLVPGHVMTVEPGVYIPGLGGCRIEDMAIITEDGYINPITAPKHLVVVSR
ncbi:Xaa-Pro peptidase family protein [Eubacteriales bacterium OttesenSCG-928-N13]|nr:Xaa-Pro peptidase family protein [Eubacteriales bacterium OttesenSCG-928-N13]